MEFAARPLRDPVKRGMAKHEKSKFSKNWMICLTQTYSDLDETAKDIIENNVGEVSDQEGLEITFVTSAK